MLQSSGFDGVVGIFHTAFQGLVLQLPINLLISVHQVLLGLFDWREVLVVRAHELGHSEGLLLIAFRGIERPERIDGLSIDGTKGLQALLSANESNIWSVPIDIGSLGMINHLSILLNS